MFLFRWIGGFFKGLGSLLAPMFTAAKGLASPNRTMRWVMHGVAVLGALMLLGFIQWFFDIGRFVSAPLPYLRQAWLPIIGLLVYINMWLIWLVWRLYDPNPISSPWPDIDYSWSQVTAALYRSGIDPSKVPVFLVLGRPSSGSSVLFESARLPLDINGVPEAQLSPVQVFAGKQAAFIVCSDTCLLGLFGDRVSNLAPSYLGTLASQGPSSLGSGTGSGPSATQASPDQTRVMTALPGPEPALPSVEEIRPLSRDPEAVARCQSRLEHVCRLIRGMRHPWCPANGIVALLPEQCTADEFMASQGGILAQKDLAMATQALGMEVPIITLFAGGEGIPGFREFLSLIPKEKRDQRLGKPIPLALVKDDVRRADIIRKTIHWQCAELIPRLIMRTFQLRVADGGGGRMLLSQVDARTNRQLIRLIRAIRTRRDTMGNLCVRLIEGNPDNRTRLSGCYLAATGTVRRGQGFLTDLFAQLFEGQNFIAWTNQAVKAERRLTWMTLLGYLVTAGLTAFTVLYVLGIVRIFPNSA
jgi:hypothetical protein